MAKQVSNIASTALSVGGFFYTLLEDGGYAVSHDPAAAAAVVTVPASYEGRPVTRLAPKAFCGDRGLEAVYLPKSLQIVGEDAFLGCTSLLRIEIESGGDFSSVDGILYTKDGTRLVQYPVGRRAPSFEIPAMVIGIGAWAFKGCEALTDLTVDGQVTSIGKDAFAQCVNLRSVSIGPSVTSIGENSFGGCRSLERMTLPFVGHTSYDRQKNYFGFIFGALTAFENLRCVPSSLKHVTITHAAELREWVFHDCQSLTHVTLSEGLKGVGDSAFSGCLALEEIDLPKSLTSLGDMVFSHCEQLRTLILPPSVERIGAHAFEACQRLERLELSTGLRQIDQKAFAGCKSLSFLSLPDGLQSVGESILSGCDGLVELVLPFVGNRKIDCEDLPQYPFGYLFGQKRNNNAKTEQFYHADSLSATRSEFYSIPPRLRSVTVKGGYLPDGAFANCAGLTEITLGEGIKRIGKWAFSCCEHLRAVHLPTTVKRIGEGAFYRCRKLTEVALPTAVKEVSPSLFTHCVSLRSLRLPKGIEAIGRYALLDCKKLTELGYGGRAEDWKKIEIEPDCGFDKRLTVRGADGTVFRP